MLPSGVLSSDNAFAFRIFRRSASRVGLWELRIVLGSCVRRTRERGDRRLRQGRARYGCRNWARDAHPGRHWCQGRHPVQTHQRRKHALAIQADMGGFSTELKSDRAEESWIKVSERLCTDRRSGPPRAFRVSAISYAQCTPASVHRSLRPSNKHCGCGQQHGPAQVVYRAVILTTNLYSNSIRAHRRSFSFRGRTRSCPLSYMFAQSLFPAEHLHHGRLLVAPPLDPPNTASRTVALHVAWNPARSSVRLG